MKSKLIRNLKRGDKFRIRSAMNLRVDAHSTIVTVDNVVETSRGFLTGKRRWEVCANYPWWFPTKVVGYSTDSIEIFTAQDLQ